MTDFINEVEEELRRDKYNDILKKWGPYIIIGALIIVAATAVWEYMKSRAEARAEAASITYFEALALADDGDLAGGQALFMDLAEVAPGGYPGMALMQAANLAYEQGNRSEAIALLEQASAEFEDPLHRDMVRLKIGYLMADTASYDVMKARVGSLAEGEGAFRYLAIELLGAVALSNGELETAEDHFLDLTTDPGTPPNVDQRAQQALGVARARLASAAPASPAEDMPATDETETPEVTTEGTDPEQSEQTQDQE